MSQSNQWNKSVWNAACIVTGVTVCGVAVRWLSKVGAFTKVKWEEEALDEFEGKAPSFQGGCDASNSGLGNR
jgi:hypothetical protein